MEFMLDGHLLYFHDFSDSEGVEELDADHNWWEADRSAIYKFDRRVETQRVVRAGIEPGFHLGRYHDISEKVEGFISVACFPSWL